MKMSLEVLRKEGPETYKDLMRQLSVYDNYLRNLNQSGVSNEALGVGLLKTFVGISDLFLRVGNTFKTNLFKFYKDLKRSEIKFYSESHPLKCSTVEGQTFGMFMHLQMDIPSGMRGPMNIATTTINNAYTGMDLYATARGIMTSLKDVRTKINKEDPSFKQGLVSIRNIVTERTKFINSIVESNNKIFTSASTKKVPFKNAYDSMNEFKGVRKQLLDMEPRLAETTALLKMVDDMDSVIADITNYLSEDNEVDRMFISDLSIIVRYMATAFDFYGVTTSRQMAIEHNHILNIDTCYNSIK